MWFKVPFYNCIRSGRLQLSKKSIFFTPYFSYKERVELERCSQYSLSLFFFFSFFSLSEGVSANAVLVSGCVCAVGVSIIGDIMSEIRTPWKCETSFIFQLMLDKKLWIVLFCTAFTVLYDRYTFTIFVSCLKIITVIKFKIQKDLIFIYLIIL